ncbi:hypothetical protein RM543_10535 [Roseicyclus sp. F158]|uniref:Uncharacterized protein n=1 Tax=Tropicimonas omnivorans TaxID=3075590 RepID=A0ABU3DHC7_9RHOB|nr:hypothetical protein [Roseicyclus sp. F158]MDT0683123.1 hypothetical protein [Roseicyclus sp. F158]
MDCGKTHIIAPHPRGQTKDLARFFFEPGSTTLEVRWNEEDLGAIEVFFDGGWQTVPSILECFRGVHASTWLKTCRSLKATDPERKEWEENVVEQAIRSIEALNAKAKASFHILDHAWTEDRIAKLEDEALASFSTVPAREKTTSSPDGRGQVILPVAPAGSNNAAPAIDPDRHAVPSTNQSDSPTQAKPSIETASHPQEEPEKARRADERGEPSSNVDGGQSPNYGADFDFPS